MQLIVHPVAIPLAEDAVAFSVTDSVEQRRIIAQQYEDTVREIADRKATMEFHGVRQGDVATAEHLITGNPRLDHLLATAEGARRLFRSLWALDRIVGYLAWEHLFAHTNGAGDLLLQRAASEAETLASQEIDSNPCPCSTRCSRQYAQVNRAAQRTALPSRSCVLELKRHSKMPDAA